MIETVKSPRTELTDEEIEKFPTPDINGSFVIGLTHDGNHPVVQRGSGWQLVNDEGEVFGDRFQKINQFSVVDGDVYYIVKFGASVQIANPNGVAITRKYHSIEELATVDGVTYYAGHTPSNSQILTETGEESITPSELYKVLEQNPNIEK